MEGEQWFLLEDALPKDALQLGSLVYDPKNPAQDNYFRDDLAGKPKQLVQRYKNYQATLEFAGNAKLSSLLKIIPKSDDSSDTVHLEAREGSIYLLENQRTWLETIGDLADARLLKYSEDHHDIYLLTGFRTLRNGIVCQIVTRKSVSAGITLVKSRNAFPHETHQETIFAVSYQKINLSFLKGTWALSLQRVLRPWSRWSRKGRLGTRLLEETDEKASEFLRMSSGSVLHSGASLSLSSFSARQDPISTIARQEEARYQPESHRGTVDEFVIHSDGSQEAMQLKHSRTPSEGEHPINSDDALAEFEYKYTSAWYKTAIFAFIVVLGPLGIAIIYGILYIFGPISLATLCSKLEIHIISPFDRSLTRFIFYLRVKCRPRVKPGHQRIEWICVGISFSFYVHMKAGILEPCY